MGRRIRARMLSDIGSARELKQALADLELRTWYAERRLAEGSREVFSVDNLLLLVMPSGGAVMNGFAVVKGLLGAFRKFRNG